MNEEENNNRRLMIWIPVAAVVGMAVGTAVGMLYAPNEGSVTRRNIRDKAVQFGEQVKDTAKNVKARVPFIRRGGDKVSPTAM